ncbi:MAG: DUF1501 domain-containing protein [Myxococcaceae bacterium]|nr:DUF1501 domain-containing protein [Myxococcaceae bacterium]
MAALGLAWARPSLAAVGPGRSLLTVWLEGGPSQRETFDPHPNDPAGLVKTSLGGVAFASFYPRLAERAHLLSVIRSLTSTEADHERGAYALKTGHRPEPGVVHPSLGAIAAWLAGAPKVLPAHVSLMKSSWPGRGGLLGPTFDAFKIASPGEHLDNLEPRTAGRDERRLAALQTVTAAFERSRPGAPLRHRETLDAALAMMRSDELEAFKVETEPAAVRAAYGSSAFGQGCLVARRLLEHGVPAVEVTLSGFDTHAANLEGHREQAALLDPALSALLDDLHARELLRSTVVIVLGEFGRTPKINAAGGRDHWPHAFSCLLAGGGLRSGVVVGETDPAGEKRAPRDPVPIADLSATVVAALGAQPERVVDSGEGRPIALSSGRARMELLT